MQDQHISLTLTRERLSAMIVAKRVSNAPMRSLIPELCAHIFSFCVLAEEHHPEPQNIWHICAPVVLSNVCRRWQAMVVHNPLLWTQLCIRLDDNINHLVRAKLWISRSASLPFHLTLRPSTLPPPTGIPESLLQPFMQAIRFLSAHIHRVKSLTIQPGIPIIPLLLSGGALPPMPHLTHLILDTDDKDDPSIVQSPLDAPLLHYLRLRDLTSMRRVLQPSLGHIRTLAITAHKEWSSHKLFSDILSQCVQLIDCTVMFPLCYTAPPTETVCLPRLQNLHLLWRGTSDPANFVGSLQTPSLDHLILQHDALESVRVTCFNRSSFENLVVSAPSLRCVTLMHCSFSIEYDISTVLAKAMNLSRLEILKCRHSYLLLPTLTSRSQGLFTTWPCPRLSHLFISHFTNEDTRPILEFVRKRIDGGDQSKVQKGSDCCRLEVLEIGSSLGILDFTSRVLMRKALDELERSGRIAIVKHQV